MTVNDKKSAFTFIKKINKFADEFDMFSDGDLVVVAVSGGADSMCLLNALLEISSKHGKRGFEVAAAHFNHKLRGEESDSDEAFVTRVCQERGIKLYKSSADVKAHAAKTKIGLVEAARELRYDFLLKTAKEISDSEKFQTVRIATAHNADDLAETLIINLIRGAGALGLSSIPPKRDSIIRPMLHISRDEIMEYINFKEIEFAEDSTNCLQNQARNKIRHSIIPLLREMNPRFTQATVKTTELLRRDEEYLSNLAEKYIDLEILMAENIGSMPYSLANRIIRKMSFRKLSHEHVSAVLELCKQGKPSGAVSLPGMIARIKEDGSLVFKQDTREPSPCVYSFNIKDGDVISIPEAKLTVSCNIITYENSQYVDYDKTFTTFLFHVEQICGTIAVGSRRKGETIKLFGSNHTKKLKKLFNEQRVPVKKRTQIPVVSDNLGVLAVYGLARSNRALPILGDKALKLQFMSE